MLEALEFSDERLRILDQLELPQREVYRVIETSEEAWEAIRSMRVRGAPAIALCAALSLAEESRKGAWRVENAQGWLSELERKSKYLETARPTAVNLSECLARLREEARSSVLGSETLPSVQNCQVWLESYARNLLHRDVDSNRRIGENGAVAIREKTGQSSRLQLLTHCNTGALATAGYGTALGVIRSLFAHSALAHVYATETRPYLQGSRLTMFELNVEGIPATLIGDSMAAMLMRSGKVDAVVVGADRIAANGDTANKIGTYALAILARHHKIPFFVAAPWTSIDGGCASGAEIEIEERPAEELTHFAGQAIAPEGCQAWNPSFDVTPAGLIDAMVTESGIVWRKHEEPHFDLRRGA